MGRRLDKTIEDDIVARWEGGCRVLREIAKAVGVFPRTVRLVLDRRGVEVDGHLKYDGKDGSPTKAEYLPTPEKIEEEKARLRGCRMYGRGKGPGRTPYEGPVVHGVDDLGIPTSDYPGDD